MALRPGWLVALCALVLSVSVWLPWLTTGAAGGGHASAIGGAVGSVHLPPRFGAGQAIVLAAAVLLVAGAMVGRALFPRLAAAAALAVSAAIVGLIGWYYRLNVVQPLSAGYGLYLGAGAALAALGCSVWAVVTAGRR